MTETERRLLVWCAVMLVRDTPLTAAEADEIDDLIADVRVPSPPIEWKSDVSGLAVAAGSDPPWLDDAIALFHAAIGDPVDTDAALRIALRFAARQPRPITEAMVESATWVFAEESRRPTRRNVREITRAALEAAESERCK